MVVEHDLVGKTCPDHVTAGGVQRALRLSRAAGRVEDEQRILGRHLGRRALRRGRLHQRRVVVVAALVHRHGLAGDRHDEHGGAIGALSQGGVGVGF
jgi:hypothetical protein